MECVEHPKQKKRKLPSRNLDQQDADMLLVVNKNRCRHSTNTGIWYQFMSACRVPFFHFRCVACSTPIAAASKKRYCLTPSASASIIRTSVRTPYGRSHTVVSMVRRASAIVSVVLQHFSIQMSTCVDPPKYKPYSECMVQILHLRIPDILAIG